MTRLTHSPIALAFKVAVGLISFLGFVDAQAQVAFGALTGKPQAPGAAVYGVTIGGTPAAPTLAATALSQSPEPSGVPQPAVSSLAFFNNSASGTTDLLASNLLYGDTYTLPGPGYSAPIQAATYSVPAITPIPAATPSSACSSI